MFRTDRSLPALLDADCYGGDAWFQRDTKLLRGVTWQLVASTAMFRKDGDFVTAERHGVPVLVRRQDGGFFAFHNVCAHRGCRLASGVGHSPQLKCPYHGWQYGADGKTRKIPDSKQFPHFDRESYRLRTYPVRQVGQLVFVHLGGDDAEPPSIDTSESWCDEFQNRTNATHWRMVLHQEIEYPTDWKIPIEGSLESYHLDEIHANTFGSAPAESECDHSFSETGSVFETSARVSSFLANLEVKVVRGITGHFNPTYRHVHVFPNVMASFTDSMTLVYQIYPTAQRQSRMAVFGFTPRSRRWGWFGKYLGWCLGLAATRLAKQVLAEDAAIFPEVQAGLEASITPRIFARSEERLHAFHKYWVASHKIEAS
ncbi:MAG: Rieske 2Fe-2S domain-containing protein, partial [Planctomycetales bacterium]|nr:Rieske 2Fe-2S domain-containing protein [Planctomycetales bacterium]